MKKIFVVSVVFTVAVLSVVGTLIAMNILNHQVATAQEPAPPMAGLTLYACSIQNSQNYIFVNQKTGDIWVYRNEQFEKHLQFKELGKNLEEAK